MLYHDFLSNKGRPSQKWAHYFPIYERHFSRFINRPVTFLEIGVAKGGSLQMWKRYFGPFAKIIGIDINHNCKRYEEEQIHVCIGDQSDVKFLQEVIEEHGAPDIVLDDGSHIMKHVCASFDFLYDKVSKDGVYMVEDLHSAYWDEFGGGLKREGTFIERCKDMIDLLNARNCRENIPSSFARQTFSMCLYDSVAVFEKTVWTKDSHRAILTEGDKRSIWRMADNKEFDVSILRRVNCAPSVIFGAGAIGVNAGLELKPHIDVSCFVDNDKKKHGKCISGLEVISFDESLKISDCNYLLAVSSEALRNDMFLQLKNAGVSEECIYSVV